MHHPITHLLPPYPTSAKAKLQAAIASLEAEECGEVTFKLLAAIAESICWSEECYQRFLQTGFSAALELYDVAAQNAEQESMSADPNNPQNWPGYDNFIKLSTAPSATKVIDVPRNWSQPLFQINQEVWHQCEQYCILGLAIDPPMDMWKYWLQALDGSNRHRWAYEYQIGINKPYWCNEQ